MRPLPFIPAFMGQKQMDLSEYEASLVYLVVSKPNRKFREQKRFPCGQVCLALLSLNLITGCYHYTELATL